VPVKLQTLCRQTVNTFEKSLHARRIAGKSVLAQLIEMARLRFSAGQLRSSEYYDYELYNDQLFSFSDKQGFIGERGREKFYARFNSSFWRSIADDKVLFHALMRALRLPTPKLLAVYCSARGVFDDVTCITERNGMADFLQNRISYPVFAKPIRGARGVGGIAVDSFNQGNETLLIKTGEQIRVHDFVANLSSVARGGYMFQECLAPHAAIREVCGDTLSTVRMIVLLSDDGPRLFRAIWRIPRVSNMTDNFFHGTTGNLIGRIDVKSGRVVEALRGVGINRSLAKVHPDTGKSIIGMILPDWEDAVEMCLSAAVALPELRLQNWDVAFCPTGPLLVEVNFAGDVDIAQYAYRDGLRNAELRHYLGL
jgi:Sugar-transfer associated ATP-grasp